MNPNKIGRRIFPTARRLLVEKYLRKFTADQCYDSVLVLGAGYDPYRKYIHASDNYIRFDLVRYPGCTDVVGNAESLPFQDMKFDCVILIEVYEHIFQSKDLINEIFRVLTPGGSVVLSVPFMFHNHGDPDDYWRPTSSALVYIFSEFREVDIYPQGNRLHSIFDLITTAKFPWSLFRLLRFFNHLLCLIGSGLTSKSISTAPTGYFLMARK